MSNLWDAMQSEEKVLSENGAVMYKTTSNLLVDTNFKVPALRQKSIEGNTQYIADTLCEIMSKPELQVYAYKWLFYLRDVRGGMGERTAFRALFIQLINSCENEKDYYFVKSLIRRIPEYGRWDDVIALLGYEDSIDDFIIDPLISNQLANDKYEMAHNRPISLLAKWMPSINASSPKTKELAKKFVNKLCNGKASNYRKMLSSLRKYLDVVECKMSANNWGEIKYENVPSYANLKYKEAFRKHDGYRYTEYIERVKNGEAKINASTLFMYDIVHKYMNVIGYNKYIKDYDETVEQLWKNLPQYNLGNILVVRDGSSSMLSRINNNSELSVMDVGDSICIYAAEHNTGYLKNKFITFSRSPQLVNLEKYKTLCSKLKKLSSFNDCYNTNVEAVFDLVLKTVIKHKIPQEEIPTILVVSDMEFDSKYSWGEGCMGNVSKALFDTIRDEWKSHGYNLPKLIFWAVASRTGGIPIKEHESGTILVSGFSSSIFRMVMSKECTPWAALKEQLDSPRYDEIGEIVNNYMKE